MFLLRDNRAPTADTRLFEPDIPEIRCPRCQWQPGRDDRWVCAPGCDHSWNTFETRGVCPACGKQWEATACHRCGQWSPHEEWYASGRPP